MEESPSTVRWPADFAPGRAPVHVRNELAMAASPTDVWAWLIRARDWPSWYRNSHDVAIQGDVPVLGPDATFRWKTFGMKLVSHVEEFIPAERIAWNARGIGVWAYHAWLIQKTASGCNVITEETQYGFLSRMGDLLIPGRMHRFHQVWLEALQEKAQQGPPAA
jgi:hypothetical protein